MLNCGAGAEIVVVAAGIVVADLELVVAPVDARNIAVRAARTRTERDVQGIQMLPCLPKIPQPHQEPLQERDALNRHIYELNCREILQLFVGFHSVAETLDVGYPGSPIVIRHDFIQVFPDVRIRRELLLTFSPHLI